MAWALVSTKSMYFEYGEFPISPTPYDPQVWVKKIVDTGTVIELIEYDGTSIYNPADGLVLMQVPDGTRRGDGGFL